ncbi:MAG: acetyltransferase [Idiomarinaceae bacterium]|nr:acetyltransferase [Idiomarinaceae bacterium]
MKKLIIIGASGHGKVVAEIAALNGYDDIQFLDERYPELSRHFGYPVIGKTELLNSLKNADIRIFCAIGDNKVRERVVFSVPKNLKFATLIHPRAIISSTAKIDEGSVIMGGAIINADTAVGAHVIINTGATIDHDCEIGRFSHISPGANLAGGTQVGLGAWMGIGSCTRQLIKIGQYAVVGAGAVVVSHVTADTTVFGNPARDKTNPNL